METDDSKTPHQPTWRRIESKLPANQKLPGLGLVTSGFADNPSTTINEPVGSELALRWFVSRERR
jgi:hypothetical protein